MTRNGMGKQASHCSRLSDLDRRETGQGKPHAVSVRDVMPPAIVEIVEIARSLAKNDTFHTETNNKSITSGK